MDINRSFFGITKEGQEVIKYTLINDLGCSVSILNYGGVICELKVPDKNGIIENIVLGHNNILDYEENSPHFGCITGRTAGRISNAEFKIDGIIYNLSKNDGNNNLHGGKKGFDKVIWDVREIETDNSVGVLLSYLSPHLEEGFPGNLKIEVTYMWNNDNELTISYYGTADKETPITITNHSYFNLSGDFTTKILNHYLQIDADKYVRIREDAIPIGIESVNGTPFDFRLSKEVGQDINAKDEQIIRGNGYDHGFVLNKSNSNNAQISLVHKESGRKLTIFTDEECVVCYTGNYLHSQMKVYDNIFIQQRGGICLETQYYPDSLNFDLVPPKTIKPEEEYRQTTVYKFSVL